MELAFVFTGILGHETILSEETAVILRLSTLASDFVVSPPWHAFFADQFFSNKHGVKARFSRHTSFEPKQVLSKRNFKIIDTYPPQITSLARMFLVASGRPLRYMGNF